jgi:predicted Zn-dependent protease
LRGANEERAEILWAQQRTEEAAAAARAEIALNASAFLSNLRLGQYLLMRRQPQDALGPLLVAVRHRRYPEAYQLLAYAYEQMGKTAESQGVVRAGLEVFRGHTGLLEMRKPEINAVTFSAGPALTEKPPALAALRAASTADDSLFWLNELYGERAGELMKQLERVAPQSARLAQAKGLSAEYDEDYEKAEEFYRESLRRSPETAGLHFSLGHVLRLQGKDEDAAAELERDVQNHLALFERALIRVKGAEFKEAIPLLEKTVSLSPQFSDAKTELAKCYLQTDQSAKAVPLLESVISRRQDHPTAHFLLSRAYRALQQPALALRELEVHRKLMQRK